MSDVDWNNNVTPICDYVDLVQIVNYESGFESKSKRKLETGKSIQTATVQAII